MCLMSVGPAETPSAYEATGEELLSDWTDPAPLHQPRHLTSLSNHPADVHMHVFRETCADQLCRVHSLSCGHLHDGSTLSVIGLNEDILFFST